MTEAITVTIPAHLSGEMLRRHHQRESAKALLAWLESNGVRVSLHELRAHLVRLCRLAEARIGEVDGEIALQAHERAAASIASDLAALTELRQRAHTLEVKATEAGNMRSAIAAQAEQRQCLALSLAHAETQLGAGRLEELERLAGIG